MDVLIAILLALVAAFVLGRLGAIAIPGPDPMPAWITIAIGVAAGAVGGGVGFAFAGPIGFVGGATFVAAALVVAYRRVFQGRGITGPEAWRYPTRGLGIAKIRARMGIADAKALTAAERQLAALDELHAEGILSAEELETMKQRVSRES